MCVGTDDLLPGLIIGIQTKSVMLQKHNALALLYDQTLISLASRLERHKPHDERRCQNQKLPFTMGLTETPTGLQ
jgi:hypothetical protein